MKAEVIRVTAKMIKVRIFKNNYDCIGIEGYCKNPDNKVKGDIIHDFPNVVGTTTMSTFDKETGESRVLSYKTGEPLAFLVFA